MWTPTARAHYGRERSHRATRLTDPEWQIVKPHLPLPAATGRPRRWPLRAVVDAIRRVLRTGEPWDALPPDYPPWQTVYRWFRRLLADGTWDLLDAALVMADRQRTGREPQPTGCVLDTQTARAGGIGVAGPRGYDPGKRVAGRKRVLLVDTGGRLLVAGAAPANRHDTRLGAALLRASRRLWPFLARCWADGGFAGPRVAHATHVRITAVGAEPHRRGFAASSGTGWWSGASARSGAIAALPATIRDGQT